MNEKNLINYYNKFNEDKRLTRRHGIIEYKTTMKYIHDYLTTMDNPKIIDIGAGTGAYSIPLAEEGFDVTAVELIKHNLMTLKRKNTKVKSYLGNATDLHNFKDNSFIQNINIKLTITSEDSKEYVYLIEKDSIEKTYYLSNKNKLQEANI